MRSSRKRCVGIATLVLALAAALAAVPGANALKLDPKPKAVNIEKTVNVPIPVAPGDPGTGVFTTSRAVASLNVPKTKKFNWFARDVNIDLHLTVPPGSNTDDLRIFVKGPNGAITNLAFFDGGLDATGFGTGCGGGATVFDDQAPFFFMAGDAFDPTVDDPNQEEFIKRPPYVGKTPPNGTLRVFNGFKPRGTWTLLVINNSTTETGTIVCFSVQAKPQKVAKHTHKVNGDTAK